MVTAAVLATLVAALILASAGTAHAPELSADQRLANSEAQGWAGR